MYNNEAKYLGYVNLEEIHSAGVSLYGLETNLKKLDFQFYHNGNIQALAVLFNRRLLLLCNSFRYETALDFVVVDCFRRPVEYEVELPIVLFGQSSSGSVVLCTSRQRLLLRKWLDDPTSAAKDSPPTTIVGKLHSALGIAADLIL